jgi:hypothetical protein
MTSEGSKNKEASCQPENVLCKTEVTKIKHHKYEENVMIPCSIVNTTGSNKYVYNTSAIVT